MNVCVAKSLDYDRISFVQSISKSVFYDRLDMANFHTSQVKFEMIILHWIIVKIFYQKPYNWARADDFDMYLMWEILHWNIINLVKFITKSIFQYKETPNRFLFFTSFIQFILKLNCIVSSEADLLEPLKKLEGFVISMMSYYINLDGFYFNCRNIEGRCTRISLWNWRRIR